MSGNDSALLTPKQRKALTEEFELLDESERSRLRSRIIAVLQDFPTLNNLPEKEREKLFKKAVGQDLNRLIDDDVMKDRSELRQGLVGLFLFIFQGLRDIGMEYDGPNEISRLLENAIMAAEGWGDVSADVEINVERYTTAEMIREKFEKGEALTDAEIGFLVRENLLTPEEFQKMQGEWEFPTE